MKQRDKIKYVKYVIETLSQKIRVSSDILLGLLKEDDWSFIIKSHALLESVISELLTTHAKDERLHKVFRRLELNNDMTGKLAFIKALELLSPEQRRFVREFSELRNSLVHNLENISFSLENHIGALDSQQKKSWQDSLTWFAEEEPTKTDWQKLALKDPKVTIWMSVFMLASSLQLSTIEIKERDRLHALGSKRSFIHVKDLVPKRIRSRLTSRSS